MERVGRRAAPENPMNPASPAPPAAIAPFVALPTEDSARDPDARWNWWISNYGTLITSSLVVLALSMLAVLVVHDRTNATLPTTTTTVPAVAGNAPTALTLPALTSVGGVNALTVTSGVTTVAASTPAKAVTNSTTAAVPSVVAAPETAITRATLSTTLKTQAPTTVASTTAPTKLASTTAAPTTAAPTTTPPTTAATTTTTTSDGTPDRTAALSLPHLQATALPASWVQVARRVASSPIQPIRGAASFRWAGPNGSGALLQLAEASVPGPTSNRSVTIRGHQADITVKGLDVTLRWAETPGVGIAMTTHGLTENEAVSVANKLSPLSDSDWSALVQRSKLVVPTSWDRILSEDW
jgi:hypothetical protein